MVSTAGSREVFVEVKQPGWRSERRPRRVAEMRDLSSQARRYCLSLMAEARWLPDGNAQQAGAEKFLDEDGGPVAPQITAMDVVRRKALPKFTDDRPNLVVVVDDLHVTPVGLPGLAGLVEREFSRPDRDPGDPDDVFTYERLGGVLFLHPVPEPNGRTIWYQADFVENPWALSDCALPSPVKTLLFRMRDGSRLRSQNDSLPGPLTRLQ